MRPRPNTALVDRLQQQARQFGVTDNYGDNYGHPRIVPDRDCCGLAQFVGMNYVNSVEDAAAICRAAWTVLHKSLVYVTMNHAQETPERVKWLKTAGFRKAGVTVLNSNSHMRITMYVAPAYKR